MLLGGFVVLGSLSSCSKDDNDMTYPTSLKTDYVATVSQQLLDVANVTVRYIGANGQVAAEQMSSTTWTKSVTIALPAKAGLSIQPTLKGPVSEGEYLIAAKGQMTYGWLDGNGQPLRDGITEYTPVMEATFYADGVGQYLGAITSTCQLARSFDKVYKEDETTIVWGGNDDENSTQNTGISNEGATGDNR
jgi:hypothetical protein